MTLRAAFSGPDASQDKSPRKSPSSHPAPHEETNGKASDWGPVSKISLFCDSQKKSLLGFSQTFML